MKRIVVFAALTLSCTASSAVAAAAARAQSGRATQTCWSGYSYNGAQSSAPAYGLSGTVTLLMPFAVSSGYAAAWLGVGGLGLGPGGSDEWLQAGIARDAGGYDVLYYEFKRPGDSTATYVQLRAVGRGESHTIVVYERAVRPDTWRVAIDGAKIGDPVALPGSHGRFQAVATVESWDGGVRGACNRYAVGFSGLAVRTQFAGGWQAFDLARILHDPGYLLTLSASGFVASSH